MTILVSGVNGVHAMLLGDRRLTYADGRTEDSTQKSLILSVGGTIFVVGFTGVGMVGSTPTLRWLYETLIAIGQRERGAMSVLEHLAAAASHDFARLRLTAPWARLTFAGVGFVIEDPSPRPILWRISNFQVEAEPPTPRPLPQFVMGGAGGDLVNGRWEPIHRLDGSGAAIESQTLPPWRDFIDGLWDDAHPSKLAYDGLR
ncbi:MAG: hypothetical protein ACREMY_30080, partial [bacterium]